MSRSWTQAEVLETPRNLRSSQSPSLALAATSVGTSEAEQKFLRGHRPSGNYVAFPEAKRHRQNHKPNRRTAGV